MMTNQTCRVLSLLFVLSGFSLPVQGDWVEAVDIKATCISAGTAIDTREEHEAYAALVGDGVEVVGDVDLTDDVTWTADKTWIVTGVVLVKGGTLTIEPGAKVLLGVGSGIRQVGGSVVATGASFEQLNEERVLAFATAPGTEVDSREEHDAYAALGGEGVEVVGDIYITGEVIWTADKTWIVTGVVLVKGGTLTIEPGAKVLLGVGSGIRQVGGAVVATGAAFEQLSEEQVLAFATAPCTEVDTRAEHDAYSMLGGVGVEVVGDIDITGDVTWSADKTWIVTGVVLVKGGTLTIEPGAKMLLGVGSGIRQVGGAVVATGALFDQLSEEQVLAFATAPGTEVDTREEHNAYALLGGDGVEVVGDIDIVGDVTWTADKTWIVTGVVLVKGGTLTIEPGTKVLLGVGSGIRQVVGFVITDGVAFSNLGFDGRMDYAEVERDEVRLDTDVGKLRVAAKEEPLAFSTLWGESEAVQVKVLYSTAYDESAEVVSEAGPAEGEYMWQANTPGYYTFSHVTGDETLTATFVVTDSETTETVFEGTIAESTDWTKGKVILVDGIVTVKSGVTLTIDPGAVVKFMDGAGIVCEAGGRCVADGVIFTHVNDDTVGGDTLLDGSTSPMADKYVLDGVSGNDATQYRYHPDPTVTLSGTISKNEVWRGFNVYHVTGSITVPSGVTLTVEPGAIIKFDPGLSLVVNSGATLNAIGTRAQPIVFTSIKDDEHGGDTNGDGDTELYPGEWTKIGVNGGTANLEHVQILYSSRNSTTGAINMNGGKVVFNNGEIAHCAYDAVGVESGNFYMTNSVIRDSLLAFRHWARDPIVNCVIYDCGRLTQGGGQNFVNCIFSHITETWEAFGFPQNGTTYRNCCFWNEDGSVLMGEGTQDAMTVCGKDGNIWGNPLFVDPDNGDFRLEEKSPCVDVADAGVAPEFDYFGQPRVNVPDIGICEVMPRSVTSDIDLVPQSVTADAEAVSGQMLTINWTVANQGGADVDAEWRDTVSLVSENGRTVALGDKVITKRLVAGGTVACSASFVVPAIAESAWYPKINVNSYRDVFEGALGENNTLTGDAAINVSTTTLDLSVANNGIINANSPTVLKLSFDATNDNRMVKFDVPAGVTVTWGFGFVPQTGGTRSSSSGSTTATDSGALFRVPDDATDVYVVLESDKTAIYNLSTETTKMTITGVSPATLPSSGTTTLTITGAGFGETNEIVLVNESVGHVVLNAPHKDISGNLIATVDCTKLVANMIYTVSVLSKGIYTEARDAILVQPTKGEGFVDYKVHLPNSLRKGREAMIHIEYKNSGNIDVPLPVFILTSDSGIRFKTIDGDSIWSERLCVLGNIISGETSLSPGETKTLTLKMKTLSSKSGKVICSLLDESLDFDANKYISIPTIINDQPLFKKWRDLCDGVRLFIANTKLTCDHSISLADIAHKYIDFCMGKSTISGYVLDDNGLGISSRLNLYHKSSTGAYLMMDSVESWENGFYCFSSLSNGEYCVKIDEPGISPSYVKVAENTITINNLDYAKCDLCILLKDQVQNIDLNLFDFDVCNDETPVCIKGKLMDNGVLFDGIYPGVWNVNVAYGTCFITNFSVVVSSYNVELSIELPILKQITGEISDGDGNLISNVTVLSEGGILPFDLSDGKFNIKVPQSLSWVRVESPDFVSKEINISGELFATNDIMLNKGVYVSGVLSGIQSNDFKLISFVSKDTQTHFNSLAMDSKYDIRLIPGAYDIEVDNNNELTIEIPEVNEYCCDINLSTNRRIRSLKAIEDDPGRNELALYYAQLRLVCDIWFTSVLYSHAAFLLERYLSCTGVPYICDSCVGEYPNSLKNDVASQIESYYYEDFNDIGFIESEKIVFGGITSPNYWAIRSVSDGVLTSASEKRIINDTEEYVTLEVELTSVLKDWYDFYESRNETDRDLGWKAYQLEKAGLAKPFWHIITVKDSIVVTMKHKNEPKKVCNCPSSCECGQKCVDCQCGGDIIPVVIPLDPNEMAGPLGVGDPETERFVKPGEWMTYTIYFENQTNATADAQEVYVTNPLSEWLDWSTFEMGEVAFGNQIDLGLSGKNGGTCEATMKGTNFVVRTTLAVEKNDAAGTRDACPYQAKWYLRIVDPTTDTGWPADILAGFLPPNDETFRGEGHLTYRIKVRDDAPASVVITNSASIVFDYNDPIETEPAWWNTVAGVANVSINDGEGGEGAGAAKELVVGVPYGDALPEKPTSAKPGYTFAGWFTGPNGMGRQITAESLVEADDSGVYAYWTANTYEVAFRANGGEGEMPNQTNTYDVVSCLASNAFVFAGHKFVGWATNETGAVMYKDGAVVSNLIEEANGVVDLFAKWGDWDVNFVDAEIAADEGSNAVVRVHGGNNGSTSSVKLYLAYNTAAAADLDLTKGTIDGVTPKGGLKFPLTLTWEAGEIGEKVITIPIKVDKTVEDDEFFTLQLAEPVGMELGDERVCTVTIRDMNDKTLKTTVTPYKPKKGETVATNSVTVASGNAKGGFVSGTGEYTSGSKLTLTAEARPGWAFVGWRRANSEDVVSDKAKWQVVVTNDAEYVAVFEKIPYVRGLADPANGGKVTGSGLCDKGKKVTLKATANKGFVFTGWVDFQIAIDGERMQKGAVEYVATTPSLVVDRSTKPAKDTATSTTITNVTDDVTYYACFITSDEDKASIVAVANGWTLEPWVSKIDTHAFRTNIWAGVYLEWPVAASALSEAKVKVAGLPAGLKFTDKPVTSKIGTGKTAVTVTNVLANTIYGAPTAASKMDRNGNVTPSAVKFTVTTAGKSTQTYQIDTVVDALPTWAQGTFAGGWEPEDAATSGGQVSLTVDAKGKTSGKALGDGLTYTLAAPYYSGFALDENQSSNFLADVTATWSYKEGTKTVKTNDVVQLIVQDNGIGGYAVAEDWFEAYAVNWKVEPWKTLGKSFDKKTFAYAILPDGSFSEDEAVLTSALSADVPARVTLKFAATGAVSVAGEFVTGYNEKTKKYTTVKATGSATLVPVDEEHGEVFIYLTPKGLPPHARCVTVPWPEE